jgi:hypothetical protein
MAEWHLSIANSIKQKLITVSLMMVMDFMVKFLIMVNLIIGSIILMDM